MKDWEKTLLPPEATILEAMKVIDASGRQIALIVNEKRLLLGTITDGDIRRAVLKNISLNSPVTNIMYSNPTTGLINSDRSGIWKKMKYKNIRQLPLVDENGCVVGVESFLTATDKHDLDNPIIIMAGGLGTRLRPLTDSCPKPLLNVGGKPILETIIENFIEYGFHKFFLSINYKGDLIEAYFKDGSDWGVSIEYLREDKQLGTAGSLSLLPETPSLPSIIINGDVLTKVNFNHLLNFHNEQKATATMCVREYDIQVPFGVAIAEKHYLKDIEEKPMHRFLVNAGIYVLAPQALSLIEKDTFYDMPTLFEKLIKLNKETIVFPIHEYWLDLGRAEDVTKAQKDYISVFKC